MLKRKEHYGFIAEDETLCEVPKDIPGFEK